MFVANNLWIILIAVGMFLYRELRSRRTLRREKLKSKNMPERRKNYSTREERKEYERRQRQKEREEEEEEKWGDAWDDSMMQDQPTFSSPERSYTPKTSSTAKRFKKHLHKLPLPHRKQKKILISLEYLESSWYSCEKSKLHRLV